MISVLHYGYLVIYNTSTFAFTIKKYNYRYIYSLLVDSVSGRITETGYDFNGNAYISKFPFGSIDANLYFSQADWTMNALSKGEEEIYLDNKQITLTPFIVSVTLLSFTTIPVTFTLAFNYTSDVYFLTQDQSIFGIENNIYHVILELSCSTSGSTAISYTITDYNGNSAPNWISINSNTGELTLDIPDESSDSDYNFIVSSSIYGVSNLIPKYIIITVKN